LYRYRNLAQLIISCIFSPRPSSWTGNKEFIRFLSVLGKKVSILKKILLSVFAISAVLALVVGATVAQFEDTETSTGNTFSAGTLDLTVDNHNDPDVVHVTLGNMKPGDGEGGAEHSTIQYQWTLCNAGTLPGQPSIEFKNLSDLDNSCTEPEASTPSLDTTCGGDPDGELSDNLYLKVNAPGYTGFAYPNLASCLGGNKCPLSTWAGVGQIGKAAPWEIWETVPAGGCTAPMVLEVEVPSYVGNIIQSDSALFDIVFHLDQI
jgi:predicted ribosomally synthesized peptide with SipW-like signal peptide